MSFACVWADGRVIRLYVADKQPDGREIAWLFDMLRRAYGR